MRQHQILTQAHHLRYPRHLFLSALLVLLTVFLYWPVHNYPFSLYDDPPYIVWNTHVRTGLSMQNIRWAILSLEQYNWHPLTWISHMTDVSVFGLSPGYHHLTNVAFHAANVVLLFTVFTLMTDAVWPSALLSGLFAMHPLHVESVAWIAERKDVLSTFFLLLTLVAYLRYTHRPSLRRMLPVVILFSFGLLAKSMLVTLPCAMLLLDWWPLGRALRCYAPKLRAAQLWRILVIEKAPLFVLSFASSVLTLYAQHQGGALRTLDAFPLGARIANAIVSYGEYLSKTVWPTDLSVLYPFPQGGPPAQSIVVSALLLAALSWCIVRLRNSFPAATIGWLWYLGTLVPVIGIIQVGNQSMADRYSYVPHIGIFFGITWTLFGLMQNRTKPTIAVYVTSIVSVISLAALALVARNQIGYWSEGHALRSYYAPGSLGERESLLKRAAVHEGHIELDAAEAMYRRALELGPDDPFALNNLGALLSRSGRLDEAITLVKSAIMAKPDYAEAHYNLGALLMNRGQGSEAIAPLQNALRLKPDFKEARERLAELGVPTK